MDLPQRIGRYEVQRVLGEGAMGRVLLGRDTVLGRSVAIKVLRDDLGLPADVKARLVEKLRQEASAAAAVSHPGIVTLHDMGEDERAGLFLVFERIDGPTLRERIARGPMQPGEVGAMARVLGAALTHAHGAGLLHRDVKPENVMLGRTGAKLTDFGIAGVQGQGTPVIGTPAYGAPEAMTSGAFSTYSDQYSLAATLYEAVTGVRPFEGDRGLSVTSRVLFHRALAERPRDRFASCEMFATLLADELEGRNERPMATPVPPSSIVPRATRRWQNSAALAGVLVIVALVIAGKLQGDDEGVSLRSVAVSFAAAAGTAKAIIKAPTSTPTATPTTTPETDAAVDR
ncbi:MAG TPA: serine/threonine-protein kinase [Polyangiaceae bacterium]